MANTPGPFDDIGGLAPVYDPTSESRVDPSIPGARSGQHPDDGPPLRRPSLTNALLGILGVAVLLAVAGFLWNTLTSSEDSVDTAEAVVEESVVEETVAVPADADDTATDTDPELDEQDVEEPATRQFSIEQFARPTITTASALQLVSDPAVAMLESVGENGLGGLIYTFTAEDEWKERGGGRRFVSLSEIDGTLHGLVLADGGTFLARSEDLGQNWASAPITLPEGSSAPEFNLIAVFEETTILARAGSLQIPAAGLQELTSGASVSPESILGLNHESVAVVDDESAPWADQDVRVAARADLGLTAEPVPESPGSLIVLSADGATAVDYPFPPDHQLLSLGHDGLSFVAVTASPLAPGSRYTWSSTDVLTADSWAPDTGVDQWQPPQQVQLGDTAWRVRYRLDRSTVLQQQQTGGAWETVSLGDLGSALVSPDRWFPTQIRASEAGAIIIAESASADRSIAMVGDSTGWETFEIDSPHASVTATEDWFMVFGLSSGTPRPGSTGDTLSPARPMDLDTLYVIRPN